MTGNVYGIFEKPAHMHRGTTEDMPRETNRITLDPAARDKLGMPVASVHFDDHPNDVAMRPRTPPWAPKG